MISYQSGRSPDFVSLCQEQGLGTSILFLTALRFEQAKCSVSKGLSESVGHEAGSILESCGRAVGGVF